MPAATCYCPPFNRTHLVIQMHKYLFPNEMSNKLYAKNLTMNNAQRFICSLIYNSKLSDSFHASFIFWCLMEEMILDTFKCDLNILSFSFILRRLCCKCCAADSHIIWNIAYVYKHYYGNIFLIILHFSQSHIKSMLI